MTTRKSAENSGSRDGGRRRNGDGKSPQVPGADASAVPPARIARAVTSRNSSGPRIVRPRATTPRAMLDDVARRREAAAAATAETTPTPPGKKSQPPTGTPKATRKAPSAEPRSRRPGNGSGSGGSAGGGGGGNRGGGRRGGGSSSGSPFGPWLQSLRARITPRRVGYWAAVIALWGGLGTTLLAFSWALELPDTRDLAVPARAPTVTILAHDGTVLARRGSGFAGAVDIDALPPYVAHAFIAIEDRRFYDHVGIDPLGIARAMVANLKAMDVVQGGSTITQQLAKNLFLTPERSLKRKVQETMLALWLESEYDKDELLTLYLNRVYFGAGAYGLEAASQRFFDKPATDLTVPEAAMLAGLVKAPSRLAPTNNPEGAQARANVVIDAMHRYGFLAGPDADTAAAFPAELAARASTETGYAVDWIEEQLADCVSASGRDMTVHTTLDPAMQMAAVGAIKSRLALSGEVSNVSQGALVAMTPDGAVRALVGGRNYRESQFNRATTALRQPGSAFKTFVYLTALERGMTPLTIRRDAPVRIGGYAPSNFRDSYEGDVSLMHALARSINTVAVRLTHEATPGSVARTARRMGITSELAPNLSLALGTSEVTLMELTSAYAPLANGGRGVIPHIITKVTLGPELDPQPTEGSQPEMRDGDLPLADEVVYEREGGGLGRVLTRTNVARMNAMLAYTVTNGTGRRAQINRPAAGKTGTSQENRDAWFLGYTADLVAGVWVGNDDSSPMVEITGGRLPAEIWAGFMTAAHTGLPARPLPGDWEPPVAVAAAPQPVEVNATAPAYDPRFGPPGYTPDGYQRRAPKEDDEPGFFSRLFGSRNWAD